MVKIDFFFLYFLIGIFGNFIYTSTWWSYVWPETLRDSSRGWFPEEWRKRSSTASSCSSYWPACMWHNPTYKMSSGPRGCRSLMGLENIIKNKKKSGVWYQRKHPAVLYTAALTSLDLQIKITGEHLGNIWWQEWITVVTNCVSDAVNTMLLRCKKT